MKSIFKKMQPVVYTTKLFILFDVIGAVFLIGLLFIMSHMEQSLVDSLLFVPLVLTGILIFIALNTIIKRNVHIFASPLLVSVWLTISCMFYLTFTVFEAALDGMFIPFPFFYWIYHLFNPLTLLPFLLLCIKIYRTQKVES
jgi:hypothetical protein